MFYVSDLLLFLPITLSVWTLSQDTAAQAPYDLPSHWPISPETGSAGRKQGCVAGTDLLTFVSPGLEHHTHLVPEKWMG